jgi:DNA gyrase subunit A
VRGIKLAVGKRPDEVISLSILRHVEADNDERVAYLRVASARRRNGEDETPEIAPTDADEEVAQEVTLTPERISALEESEEFLLTVTDAGFGKRSSAYEYRVTGRGGQGITGITLTPRTGSAVAGTFPVRPGDDVMLVTDAGRLIRIPADQVRITGRASMGVTVFRLDSGERVTSVFPVVEDGEPDSPPSAEAGGPDSGSGGPAEEPGDPVSEDGGEP